MKTYRKQIGSYLVEVTTGIDSDPSTEGWVECGHYSASIACACDTGCLFSGSGADSFEGGHVIPDAIAEEILDWAESVGY